MKNSIVGLYHSACGRIGLWLTLTLTAGSALGQPEVAWVTRYNGGFENRAHTPIKMALDGSGNVYVAGTSADASGRSNYLVLKYTPGGTQVFAARHSSTNPVEHVARGFALDGSGNTYVTGTGDTVKFNTAGQVSWTAPYGGADVVVDANEDVYVTGFSEFQLATVKLDNTGSNLWAAAYKNDMGGVITGSWRHAAQKLAVDRKGLVYVAGWESWGPDFRCSPSRCRYYRRILLTYSAAGVCLQTNAYWGDEIRWGNTIAVLPTDDGSVLVASTIDDSIASLGRVASLGSALWGYAFGGPAHGIALDSRGDVILAAAAVSKVAASGTVLWRDYDPGLVGQAVACDVDASFYVVGYINRTNGNHLAMAKFSDTGARQWLVLMNEDKPANDAAKDIAVAPDGSVYVAGYSANAAGGTDIILIKYASQQAKIRKAEGALRLEGSGVPNKVYTFQGTTNLLDWSDLGTATADSNGVFQYIDPNAGLFPYRFYRYYVP